MPIMFNTYADAYEGLRHNFMQLKVNAAPRGKPIREFIGIDMCIVNPCARAGYHPARKWSLVYALVDSLMLFSPRNDLKLFSAFNPRMEEFSDDGLTLYGAYGPRIALSLDLAIRKLKEDADTRQAIIYIGKDDDILPTRDMPCTISLQFMLRAGALSLLANMRSGDFFLGLPYDIFAFTTLQEIVANTLGVPMGMYFHNVASLHLYESDATKVEEVQRLEPIENKTELTVNEARTLADNYCAIVDGEATSMMAGHSHFHSALINNELTHREGARPLPLLSHSEWARPFVKRWYR